MGVFVGCKCFFKGFRGFLFVVLLSTFICGCDWKGLGLDIFSCFKKDPVIPTLSTGMTVAQVNEILGAPSGSFRVMDSSDQAETVSFLYGGVMLKFKNDRLAALTDKVQGRVDRLIEARYCGEGDSGDQMDDAGSASVDEASLDDEFEKFLGDQHASFKRDGVAENVWNPESRGRVIRNVIINMLIAIPLTAIALWVGMKMTGVDGSFGAMVVIGLICALVSLIPFGGNYIAIGAMYLLIYRLTNAERADAVLLVVIGKGMAMIVLMYTMGVFLT